MSWFRRLPRRLSSYDVARYSRALRRHDPYAVYLTLEGALALLRAVVGVVSMVYQVEVARLNPLQLVLVGTVMEVTAFVTQVPTGVFADLYSRKVSVLLGVFFLGLGALVQGLFPAFGPIALASGITCLGLVFISGAEEAWLAEEVGEERIGGAFLRGTQVGQVGALAGMAIGTALGTIGLQVPIVTGGGLIVLLSVVLIPLMRERRVRAVVVSPVEGERRLAQAARDFVAMLGSGARAVRGSAVLAATIFATLFFGLFSEGFDRLNVDHFLKDYHLPPLGAHPDVYWFGLISAGTTLSGLVVVEVVRRRLDTRDGRSMARAMIVANAVLVASVVAFALAGNFALALACFWSASLMRQIDGPIYTAWLTQRIPAPVRATVLSFDGQIDALGQIAGGPIVGAIGLAYSVRAALVTTGALLLPALPLLAFAGRHTPATVSDTPDASETAPVLPPVEALEPPMRDMP